MGTGNYGKHYLKNIVTQILATITGFLSLFIVVPSLSENKSLFGIYSVCVSLTIFFNYADLGFLSSGQKFAAESYIRSEKEQEINIMGFTTFILLVFSVIISIFIVPTALNPKLLISNIEDKQLSIASNLLWILILFTPFIIFKRICCTIFTIRIEQYKYNYVVLAAQLLKVLSVFLFFQKDRYLLVEYFLSCQILDFISSIILLIFVIVKYDYGYHFFKKIRFISSVWHLVKNFAFVSLFSTFSWILYYELDLIVLAKLSKPDVIALYSTAFTLLSLSRNFFAIIYSSFAARFNHFFGLGDLISLKKFFLNTIYILFPIVFFPILIFIIIGDPFVISWAGEEYKESAILAKFLITGSIFASLSYPSTLYLQCSNRIKEMYISASILPLFFWFGVYTTFSLYGALSFAFFKALSQIISALYSFVTACMFQGLQVFNIITYLIKKYLIPSILTVFLAFIATNYMYIDKGYTFLVINIVIIGAIYIVSILFSILFSKQLRTFLKSAILRK